MPDVRIAPEVIEAAARAMAPVMEEDFEMLEAGRDEYLKAAEAAIRAADEARGLKEELSTPPDAPRIGPMIDPPTPQVRLVSDWHPVEQPNG